jgi:MoxR-like ATPase
MSERGSEPSPSTHLRDLVARVGLARSAVGEVVIGQREVVDQLFVAILAGGHVLLEGAPGLGKTMLVRTVAAVLGLRSSRIQFTPDLMPGDITGNMTLVHDEEGRAGARFLPGPVFAELVLADEINRSTPKTQSALLEAMQEGTVTVAGGVHPLPRPFFVLATQNPIEMEGTYILPEAQVDRFFFKIDVPYPSQRVLADILTRTTAGATTPPTAMLTAAEVLELQGLVREVPMPTHLVDAVAGFAVDTQPGSGAPVVASSLRNGVSPRGAQALVLAAKGHALMAGRFAVTADDLLAIAAPALRHRVPPSYEAEVEGRDVVALVTDLLRARLA